MFHVHSDAGARNAASASATHRHSTASNGAAAARADEAAAPAHAGSADLDAAFASFLAAEGPAGALPLSADLSTGAASAAPPASPAHAVPSSIAGLLSALRSDLEEEAARADAWAADFSSGVAADEIVVGVIPEAELAEREAAIAAARAAEEAAILNRIAQQEQSLEVRVAGWRLARSCKLRYEDWPLLP